MKDKSGYYDELQKLPEVRAGHITYERFLIDNNSYFRRITTAAFNNLPSCHITLEDLEQEAKSWCFVYIFGTPNEPELAYRLNCCNRLWPNPSLYLRHRRTHHSGQNDELFARYVGYNTHRKVRHVIREQYAKKRNVKQTVVVSEDVFSFSADTFGNMLGEISRNMKFGVSCREMHSLSKLFTNDVEIEAMIDCAMSSLDERAKFLLQRMLNDEVYFNTPRTRPSIQAIRESFAFLRSEQ